MSMFTWHHHGIMHFGFLNDDVNSYVLLTYDTTTWYNHTYEPHFVFEILQILKLICHVYSQSAEPLPLSELKGQRCLKISAEEMLSLLVPSTDWRQSKPKLVVIDIRTADEYPCHLHYSYTTVTPLQSG